MARINLTNTMICWTPADAHGDPTAGKAGLVPWPDTARRDPFECSSGACYDHIRTATPKHRSGHLAAEALCIALRDGVPLEELHRAFWPLEEWKSLFPEDVTGPIESRRS